MKRKEERLKVYISGPLTDKKTCEVSDENRIAFGRAQCLIKKEGYYDVINPTRVWACRYPWIYRAMERVFGKSLAYKLVLLYDVILLLRCSRIYKIPGWRESRGASIESNIAYHFDIWPLPVIKRERIDRKLAKAMEKWREKNAVNPEQQSER